MECSSKQNSSVSGRMIALASVIILVMIGAVALKVYKKAPQTTVLREAATDPNFLFYAPLPNNDVSLLFAWRAIPEVKSNETTLDSEVLHFLNKHNAIRAKLQKVSIDADSLWQGFSDDRLWPLHLEWDRGERTVSVEADGQKCVLNEAGVFLFSEKYYGSMHTNLVHLVMLAAWHPKELESAVIEDSTLIREGANGQKRSVDVKVLAFPEESAALYFEKSTGLLVRVEGPLLEFGTLQADMDDFVVLDEAQDIVLPTTIRTTVPDGAFHVPLPPRFERVIQITVEPNDVQLEYCT